MQISSMDYPVRKLSDGRLLWLSGKTTGTSSKSLDAVLGKKPEDVDQATASQSLNEFDNEYPTRVASMAIQPAEIKPADIQPYTATQSYQETPTEAIKVAQKAVEPEDKSNLIPIHNSRTKEVKWIRPSEAQNYGVSPDTALSWLEAQKAITNIEQGVEDIGSDEKLAREEAGNTVNEVLRQFGLVPADMINPAAGFVAKNVPYVSAEARQYERTREGVAGTLKSVVGETGVLTDRDIERIVGLLPAVTNTPEENDLAISGLKSFLKGKGIEVETEEKPMEEKKEPETADELLGRGYFQKLTSVKALGKLAGEAPGIVLGSLIGTGQNIADFLKGNTEAIKDRNAYFKTENERINNLAKAASQELTTKAEAYLTVRSLFSLGKGILNRLKGTPPQDIKTVLNQGMEQVKQGQQVRMDAINSAKEAGIKVNGDEVYNAVSQWSDDAGSLATENQKKVISKYLEVATNKFKGKMLDPETAKKAWDIADDGFTSAGKAAKPIQAGFHRAVREGLRQQLDEITQGAFEAGTKLIHDGLSLNKVLSSLGRSLEREVARRAIEGTPSPAGEFVKKTAKGALTTGAKGLGLYAVAKALGLQFPGAAY